MISSFSSLNGIMLASPRVFFAMADDGLLSQRSPVSIRASRRRTSRSCWPRARDAPRAEPDLRALTEHVRAGDLALLRAQRRGHLPAAPPAAGLPRPYRVIGYPVVPAIFILSVVGFVLNALVNDRCRPWLTFALILAGVPVYQLLAYAERVTQRRSGRLQAATPARPEGSERRWRIRSGSVTGSRQRAHLPR